MLTISACMEYAIIFKFHVLFLPLFWSEKGRDLFNTQHLDTPGIMRRKHPASSIGIYYILKNVPFHFSLKKNQNSEEFRSKERISYIKWKWTNTGYDYLERTYSLGHIISHLACSKSLLYLVLIATYVRQASIVDPWTTWIWTCVVYLYADFVTISI